MYLMRERKPADKDDWQEGGMNKLRYIISRCTDPYRNIALEEYLLTHTEPGERILYLWQNRKTVVVGYNQNAWKECRIEELEADGGFLARRLSGGGAVFHDLGNLNFTFLARRGSYNVEQQTEVILRAVRSFGINAVRNGRNDLVVDGKKFSGNAFYCTGDCCCHHGTILICADKQEISRYLNVSYEKLQSKGVESVKSRVENLTAYKPSLTVEQMKNALLDAFADIYQAVPLPIAAEELPEKILDEGEKRFSAWEWLYGKKIPFNFEVIRRFEWGEALVRLEISEGIIREAGIWTDDLDTELPRKAGRALAGCRYQRQDIERALAIISQEEGQKEKLINLAECLSPNQIGGNDGETI